MRKADSVASQLQKDRFTKALRALGGSADNGRLREMLGWDEVAYAAVMIDGAPSNPFGATTIFPSEVPALREPAPRHQVACHLRRRNGAETLPPGLSFALRAVHTWAELSKRSA